MILNICSGQNSKSFYSEDFGWKINLSENYRIISNEEVSKIKAKGRESIEKATGKKVNDDGNVSILKFQDDKNNFFYSSYSIYNEAINGDYSKGSKTGYDLLYRTIKTKFPDIQIDQIITTEKVNSLDFEVYKLDAFLPNITFHQIIYSRLFGNKSFVVTLVFTDEKAGEEMLELWKKSSFD
jgi:hypothetical protein